MKIKEDKLEELKWFGFKPDKRKDILCSINDELFGEIAKVGVDRELYISNFSDDLIFRLMGAGVIE